MTTRRRGRYIGFFPSLKNKGEGVPYEGKMQKHLFYFWEYDPTVVAYRRQPFRIMATSLEGSSRVYIPDFLLVRTNSEELVRCVPAKIVDKPEYQHEFALLHKWANANGYEFRLITDNDLKGGHQLENLQLLWRYCRISLPVGLTSRCIAYLKDHPNGLAFGEVAAYLAEDKPPLAQSHYLYKLLFQQILQVDLSQRLNASSHIWISSGVK